MKRRDVYLSSWSVDLDRDPIRNPPRPLSLRHLDYEDNFDFTTIFYDCFWDHTGGAIILIGPPLANLETDLDLAIVACPSMVECKATPGRGKTSPGHDRPDHKNQDQRDFYRTAAQSM
jgi:hypothetical protein